MYKLQFILLLLVSVLLFTQCKKEEENWTPCIDCDLSSWVGTFEGSAVYFHGANNSSTTNVPTQITIDNTFETSLQIIIIGDDVYTATTTVDNKNNDYYIEMASSSSSLSLTLYKKDNSYKLSGTSKKYHYEYDTLLVVDQSLSYDTFKATN